MEIARPPEFPAVPLYLVGHPSSRGVPRVRAVWDFLVHLIGSDPALDPAGLRPSLRRAPGGSYKDG